MMMCEICNHEMKNVYHKMNRNENIDFFKCPECGLRYAPKLDVDRSFRSKLNEDSRRAALSYVREKEFEQVNNLVRRFVKEKGRGLEVGCAYGWYMDSIKNQYKMEGIEPEASIAETARKNGHIVYTGFFPEDMPNEDDKYDFIVFNNVWEHINHTTELIKGTLKHLAIGGVVFITVPLSTGGLYRTAELLERFGYAKWLTRLWQLHFHSPHIYYFNKSNFERIMNKNGCYLETDEDVRASIDPSHMKERFEMDKDEKHARLRAMLFQMGFPIIRKLPADKALFVFRYKG